MEDKEKIEKLVGQINRLMKFTQHKHWCLNTLRHGLYTGNCDCGLDGCKAFASRLLKEVEDVK